jgi:Flp pilus assembly pilin Flp
VSAVGQPETENVREDRVSSAVRAALLVEAPPDLSARLLVLSAPAARPARIDMALKSALVVQAPPDLSQRLLQLVPAQPAVTPTWSRRVQIVYGLTAVLLAVVLVAAGQVYGLALQELGIGEFWQGLAALPAEWLDQLYRLFPQGRYVVEAFWSLQRALQWVLIGLLMWAVIEMRSRRQAASYQPSMAGS